jgi:hypothetical protein
MTGDAIVRISMATGRQDAIDEPDHWCLSPIGSFILGKIFGTEQVGRQLFSTSITQLGEQQILRSSRMMKVRDQDVYLVPHWIAQCLSIP